LRASPLEGGVEPFGLLVKGRRAAPSAEGCITGFSSGDPAFLMEEAIPHF